MVEHERLHTRLSPRTKAALRETIELTGRTQMDVVGRAIELYNVISKHVEEGAEIVIHHSDGSSERIPKLF